MKGFSPGDGCVWVDVLEYLGEGIEQTPSIPWMEVWILGVPPVPENLWDLGGGDSTAVRGLDDEVMGCGVGEPPVAIGIDAPVEVNEMSSQLSHRPSRELAEVSNSKPCVLAADLNQAGEGKVVADEDPRASHQASRESLVVRVAQSDDPAVVTVRGDSCLGNLQKAEVAMSAMADCMGLGKDAEARILELVLDFGDEVPVREREPRIRGRWSLDVEERSTLNDFAAAMKDHAVLGGRSWCRVLHCGKDVCLPRALFIDKMDHGVCLG